MVCGLTILSRLNDGGTLRSHPAATESVAFELLVFTPGPIRQSSTNLDTQDSSRATILTRSSARAPNQRNQPPPSCSPTQAIHTHRPRSSSITGVRHNSQPFDIRILLLFIPHPPFEPTRPQLYTFLLNPPTKPQLSDHTTSSSPAWRPHPPSLVQIGVGVAEKIEVFNNSLSSYACMNMCKWTYAKLSHHENHDNLGLPEE